MASVAKQGADHSHGGASGLFTRMREATGTVYGDIGTSVLYTLMEITRETVALKHHVHGEELTKLLASGGDLLSRQDILGGLSLVFWALIFVTVKYDLIIMKADNHGEGGTFALWALLKGSTSKIFGLTLIGYLVVAAAGLLAADGVITPPISMLGAYEPLGESLAVAATILSLFILFKPQWRGTSQVGGLFGWFMMLVWFPWIAIKGVPWILKHPDVFLALDPSYAVRFLADFPGVGLFVILGVVVLAITGGEAKYADIGHFARRGETYVGEGQSLDPKDSGRRPVMGSWLALVLPCLLLNYAGQASYLLARGVPPRANTFYALTPKTGDGDVDFAILIVDMVISGIAAFIASQALITGMFSIVKQAIALGFCPRFAVKFTSREAEGQVYIPAINWAMFIGCVTITLVFRTAGNLAAAYGIAVTGTMGITTLTFGYVAHYRWGWGVGKAVLVCAPILAVDLLFFASNLLKFTHGGYYPVAIAAVLVTIMMTWQWGRGQLAGAFYAFGVQGGKKMGWLVALREKVDEIQLSIQENLPLARTLVQGRRRLVETDRAFVFLCSRPIRDLDEYVPVSLRVFLKKYGVLPAHITLFHVRQLTVAEAEKGSARFEVFDLGRNIVSITATYGYMEQPDIRGALRELQLRGEINIPSDRWIIESGEEEIITSDDLPRLTWVRILLFRFILRLSTPAHKFLGLGYDAGVSKEIIPVVFSREGVKVALPELEINDPEAPPHLVAG
ncbi:KUP/HAK/KT family potassium transporter [Planctomyces sp. SH-PL62]|uniref:KUP/HAK/KT family potassium transporter n=1 Tax=Planctomyces sp. SH-PL62 TaxID=1636152 RepID=UPI00078BC012|nr:KUP/HAK/KT family potassium transporter [Planctomyces sp. SH-PL62]AMV36924.1 potassium transport protein Kup [Planctomyces sp. SH-PL62]